ncbi:Na(+)/H(+) antiporter subunit C [Nocardioidaceae bacterium SCSIO 66511]|nr:Na(+)/H(+) antiporter subunit C [Nocardioidaceae bacterium SCSIO 66511]
MSANLTLIVTIGALFAAGVPLVLERSLSRILIGVLLLGNGANLLFLVASGRAGYAPIVGVGDEREQMSDPLPQAMVLTAIVITLGMTAFLLAMSYRSWQLNRNDDVQDDVEDALIRRLAELDEASTSFDDSEGGVADEEGSDETTAESSEGRT